MAKKVTSKGKDVSVKAVKQKLELSAAKLKAEQQEGNVGSDKVADSANTDHKVEKIDGRKINLSEFVKGEDGKVSVTLKFSDKSVIQKFKLAAEKVQVEQTENKMKISGESADVREALETILFQPGLTQNSFRIGIEVVSSGRSIKSSLSVDFNRSTGDLNLKQSFFEDISRPVVEESSVALVAKAVVPDVVTAIKMESLKTPDYNTSAKPEAEAFTLSLSPADRGIVSDRVIDTVDVRLVNSPSTPAPSPEPEPNTPPVIPSTPVTPAPVIPPTGGGTSAPTNNAPTDITLSALTVAENADGTVVGTFATVDADAGNTHTYTLTDASNKFEIVGGSLKVKDGESLDYEGQDSYAVTVRTTDNGGLSYNKNFTINVTDVNEAPTLTNISGTRTHTEGGAATVVDGSITIGDVDSSFTSITGATIRISNGFVSGDSLNFTNSNNISHHYDDSTGILTLTTDPLHTSTQADYEAAIESITFSTSSDNPTNANRTISVTLNDGALSSNTQTITMQVTPVDDAPVNAVSGAQSTVTNTPIVFSSGNNNLLSVSDVDSASLASYQLSVDHGTLTLSGTTGITVDAGADGSATMTISGTVAAINAAMAGLTYTPVTNYSGADTLTIIAGDGTTADTDTVAINVVSVNAPVNVFTSNVFSTSEDTGVVLTGISVTDANDASLATYTITATNGTITLNTGVALGVSLGQVTGNGTSTVTITGATLTEINTTLANITGLTYTPTLNYNGAALVTITADDGAESDIDAIAITVNPLNDAPVNTVPGAQSTNASTPLVISGISVADIDNTTMSTYTLSVNSGTLTLNTGVGGGVNAGQITGNGTGTITITGATKAAINATLANGSGLTFSDAGGANATLTVTANDGTTTDVDTVAISVLSPPVLTNLISSVTFAENTVNTTPQLIDTSVSVTDVNSSNFAGGNVTVTYSAGGSAQDALSVRNEGSGAGQIGVSGATISYGGVAFGTITTNGAAGADLIISFNASSSPAAVQALIQNLTYSNSSHSPTAARTISITIDDGDGGTSAAQTAMINVTAENDVPTIAAFDNTPTYTEGNAAITVDSNVTLSDNDHANLASVTVTITNASDGTNEVLAVTDSGGVTSSYNSATHTLTLSGAASVAAYQTVLRTLTYINNDNDPTAGSRTLSVVASDGTDNSTASTTTLTVAAFNNAPVNTVAGAQTIAEDALTAISGISVADVDNTSLTTYTLSVTQGTITLSTSVSGGLSSGQISGNGTDTVTVSGATLAAINATLADANGISYQGNSNYTGADTLTITANDGALTDTDTVAITVSAVNDAPVNNVPVAQSTNASTPLVINGISVTEHDGDNLTYTLSVDSGTLTLASTAGLTFSAGDGTNDSTMTFSGTVAAINAAVAGLTFNDDNGANATLTITANDGALTDVDTVAITVLSPPVLNNLDASVTFAENTVLNSPQLIDTSVQVTDVNSSNFDGGNVTVTYSSGGGAEDSLSVRNEGSGAGQIGVSGISNEIISYGGTQIGTITTNGAAGANLVISLNNNATPAAVQALIQNLTYSNSSNNPAAARTISITIDDGDGGSSTSIARTTVINVTAENDIPVITGLNATVTPTPPSYTEGDTAIILDSDITVTDDDNANLSGATISISGGFVSGDRLNFTDQNGITGSYNAGSGVLTLSGSATKAHYEAALESITFESTSDNPGSGDRTISFVVSDGTANSTSVSTILTVAAVNDAPVNTVPAAQNATRDATLTFSSGNGNLISVADADNTSLASYQISVDHGTLSLSGTAGLTFSVGDGTADATMTFSGTVSAINTALAGLVYTPTGGYSGADTITIVSNDGALSNTDTVAINVGIPPVNNVPGAQTFNEDTTRTFTTISVSDGDSTSLTSYQISVLHGTLQLGSSPAGLTIGGNNTGSITLSGDIADINTALDGLVYTPTANYNGTDTLTIVANDGSTNPATTNLTLNISAQNDAPVNTVPGAQTTGEGDPLVISGISVTEVDGDTLTYTLSVNSGTLTLNTGVASGITAGMVTNNGTGTITVTGATVAQINATMAHVSGLTFNDASQSATLSVTANDGLLSDTDTVAINVTLDPRSPINSVPSAQTFNEDTNRTFSSGNGNLISISDTDTSHHTVTLTVSSGTITLSQITGLSFTPSNTNGTASMTFSGSTTNINAALAGLIYAPTSNYNGTDTLTITTSDGTAAADDTDNITLNITAVNDAPVLSDVGASTAYTQNATAVTIDSSATIADVDNDSIASATVAITAGGDFVAGGGIDALNYSTLHGVTGSYNAGTGVLTLTGPATKAQYEQILESVTFSSTSDTSGNRTISYTINDGTDNSNTQTATINYSLPSYNFTSTNGDNLSGTSGTDTYTATDGAHVQGNDSAAGGSGADTLTVSGGTLSLASGAANITGIETWQLNSNAAHNLGLVNGNFTNVTNGTIAVTTTSTTGITVNASASTTTTNEVNITGGTGNDTLLGSYGADTLIGGDGNDSIGNNNETFSSVTSFSATRAPVSTQTTNLTMSTWLKWNGDTSGVKYISGTYEGNTNGYLFSVGNGDGFGGGGNKIGLYASGVDHDIFNSTTALTANVWTHLAVTRDGTTWRLYVNGVQVHTSTQNINPIDGTSVTGFFTEAGALSDVRFYDRQLTAGEVANLYNRESVSSTSLAAHYKLDETSGVVANDSSGNGRNITAASATWSSDGSNSVDGGNGADTLTGGSSTDTLTGGANADRFVWEDHWHSSTTSPDRITDFSGITAGQLDKIDISGFAVSSFTMTGLGSLSSLANQLVWNQSGSHTLVQFDRDGNGTADWQIQLDNFTASTLVSGDFIVPTGTNYSFTSTNGDNLSGTGLADTYTATDGAHVQGNDSAAGGSGADTLTVSGGTLSLASGAANITGIETWQLNSNAAHNLGLVNGNFTNVTNGTIAVTTTSSTGITVNASASTTTTNEVNVTGGTGNDTLLGSAGGDTLAGGVGTDSIDGGQGADSISAGDNNDTIEGGYGGDTIDAGAGDDVIYADNASFSAASFSGLFFWADANDLLTSLSNGSSISTWTDKATSDGTQSATSSGADRPTLSTTGIGGRAAVSFDGTQFLASDTLAAQFNGNGQPISIFSAFKPTSTASGTDILAIGNSSNSDPLILQRINSNQYTGFFRDSAGTVKTPTAGTVSTNSQIGSYVFNGSTLNYHKDGAAVITAGDGDVGSSTFDRFTIGALRYAAGELANYNGLLGEILVFNTSVSDVNRLSIEEYLSMKYGVALSGQSFGVDLLTGGTGADTFVWTENSYSNTGSIDRITDFSGITAGQLDKIDISGFSISSLTMTGLDSTLNGIANELIWYQGTGGDSAHTFVAFDRDGNSTADWIIQLDNFTASTLVSGDFIVPSGTSYSFTTTNGDNLSGTAFGDTYTATDGAHVQGNDSAAGGSGADTLTVSGGTLSLASGAANITGIETWQLNSNAAHNLGLVNGNFTNVTNGTIAVTTTSTTGITVNASASTTTTNEVNITGGSGNDTLTGSYGADTIFGDAGNDTINNNNVAFSSATSFAGSVANVSSTTTNLTMATWFKWGGANSQVILFNGNSGANGYGLMVHSTNKVTMLAGGINFFTSSTALTADTWAHLALTRDGSTWRIYVNGVEVHTTTTGVNSPSANFNLNQDGGGSISDARFYNRQLSAGEVANLYNRESVSNTSLAAHWKLDETSGVVANDSSGNVRHITASSATWSSDGSNSVSGGDGVDTLTGGSSTDTLTGGADADRFVWEDHWHSSVTSPDRITDFSGITAGQLDKIDISGFSISSLTMTGLDSTLNGIANELIWYQGTGGDSAHTFVAFDRDGNSTADWIIQLDNFTASTLVSGDFIVPSGTSYSFTTTNGDNLSGTGFADSYTASDGAHVQANDSAAGGSGADTLTVSGGTLSLASGAANITGIETWQLNSNAAHNLGLVNGNFTNVTNGTIAVTTTSTPGITVNASAVTTTGYEVNVTGGTGNDTLLGSAGNDTLAGGVGTDSIDGGLNTDNISGGDSNDTLHGAAGNDTIDGGDGNDVIDGNMDQDSLSGGAGNDTIYGGDLNFGNVLSLDGTNDYVRTADSNSLDVTSTTVSAWVYGDSWADASRKTILEKGFAYYMTVDPATGKLAVYAYGKSSAGYHLSNATLSTGTWNHVAMTVDTNGFSIYINGVLDRTITATGTIDTSSDAIGVGGQYDGGARYFDGNIEDIRVYNRALTASEIDNVYKGITPTTSGLRLHYTFDEASGNALDGSGNSNTGTLQNGATRAADTAAASGDTLTGGIGADYFTWRNNGYSLGTSIDRITDFSGITAGELDKIDISGFSLSTGITVNRSGVFTNNVNELIYLQSGSHTLVQFDRDGNGTADWQIQLDNFTAADLRKEDFILSTFTTTTTGNDIVVGSNDAADTIDGGNGADRINGQGGGDSLTGGAGNDTLAGGLGNDILTGGADNDYFQYTSAISGSADTITDFASGSDKIAVSDQGFVFNDNEGSHSGVVFTGNDITTGTANGTWATSHRFYFETDTQQLWYDQDGGAVGTYDPILLLTIQNPYTFDINDFIGIA